MDKASLALAEDACSGVERSFRARSQHTNIPRTTLQHRARGRPSLKAKAESQQYLDPWEEKALVAFLVQQDALGRPVRIKYVGSIAFSLARQRTPSKRPSKPPGKNWPQHFYKRHPELKASTARALDWKRYEIHDKVVHWFDVIGQVLQDPNVLRENVYNMDETGIMLSQRGSVKVLTRDRTGQRPRVLICDGFGTHETLEVLEFCFENNITLCRLPSHTSHKLQPCDIAVFGPLKAAYRDQVERLERGGVGTIGKEHFTYLYTPARERAFTSRNIRSGWAKAGLFPFDPAKVVKDLPPATIGLAGLETGIVQQDPVSHDPSPHTPVTPKTPVTPVSAEAVHALHNLIKLDTDTLDVTRRQRFQEHLEKLTNATQLSFAERALLREPNQFLAKINNEAKARRSTKTEIIGTARVMSYEDLAKARMDRALKEAEREAKRAEKKAKKAGSARSKPEAKNMRDVSACGQLAPDSDAQDLDNAEALRIGIEAQECRLMPGQCRAPVARMW
ncbi:hypothetical protein CKM354_001126400 [Cercospora kikuchii]|uniref:HTH CENPB-type domain-containing protein n=1 Tax=Cercospora kikuchii TaxID=84275 RepID=A0A9P3D054_9PEZI|nr:uncharacterized protein CKM354_001126400 [Cercospora kikuchii]GIZ48193.1 hypothetical protein CKM354_001126400 [Cercospora kikuchii]